MNKLVKIASTTLAAAGILFSTIVVAPIASAAPAQAVTYSSCYSYYEFGWRYTKVCYHDFNWWEESWMGGAYRDGWYRLVGSGSA